MNFILYDHRKITRAILSIAVLPALSLFFAGAGAQCNNYLFVAAGQSGVQIGKLDVGGDHLTVEAVFKRTEPYVGGLLFAGDLVSKHSNSSNCNYLLRPNGVAVTTVNGFSSFDTDCEIELNKTYHVAMVYDGSTLKFYRNGVLKGSSAASGNLVTNDFSTTIGSCAFFPNNFNEDLRGYINEVRIWDIARTQEQINEYMTIGLPNPSSQTGLLAYYQFDDLLNKQGNALWNASILGNATINATNTGCGDVLSDNCLVAPLRLVSFDGDFRANNYVDINFSTANEEGAFTIAIERKYDSGIFELLKTLAVKGGNALNNYQFSDFSIPKEHTQIFYRLKMTDLDGTVTYSKTLLVLLKDKQTSFLVYPNPAKHFAQLKIKSLSSGRTQVSVTNQLGSEVLLQSALIEKGTNSIPIKNFGKLQSGIYFVHFVLDNNTMSQKLVIQ